MLDVSKFILKPEYFDYPESRLHGIAHTYRVMTLVWLLGERVKLPEIRKTAFMAAFIHDMARRHDGYCNQHGRRAVKYKLPQFSDFFKQQGATDENLKEIAFAVHNHCKFLQPGKHPYFQTLALLKDADALDRIRISKYDLNPRMLRFKESHEMINLAEKMYYQSLSLKEFNVLTLLKIVEEIN